MNENEYELRRDIEPNKVKQKTAQLGEGPWRREAVSGTEKKNNILGKEDS